MNIKSIGVNSLLSLAYNTSNKGYVASIISSNNSTYYYALYYLNNDNSYTEIIKPSLNTLSHILEHIKCEINTDFKDYINYQNDKDFISNISFVGNGAVSNKDSIFITFSNCIIEENIIFSSYNLGLAGYDLFENEINIEPLPLYLKKPQAQIDLELRESKNLK